MHDIFPAPDMTREEVLIKWQYSDRVLRIDADQPITVTHTLSHDLDNEYPYPPYFTPV